MRLIVGISGASGVIYGVRLLEILKDLADVETHLVLSNGGKLNISLETGSSSTITQDILRIILDLF